MTIEMLDTLKELKKNNIRKLMKYNNVQINSYARGYVYQCDKYPDKVSFENIPHKNPEYDEGVKDAYASMYISDEFIREFNELKKQLENIG